MTLQIYIIVVSKKTLMHGVRGRNNYGNKKKGRTEKCYNVVRERGTES